MLAKESVEDEVEDCKAAHGQLPVNEEDRRGGSTRPWSGGAGQLPRHSEHW